MQGADVAFAAALGGLDSLLATVPYLTGATFGLADISYVPWVIRARDLLGVTLEPFPALADWLARLSERPSVQAELDVVAAL